MHNPQALVSVEAQAQLEEMFSVFGAHGAALFNQMMQVLRQSLNFALTEVFLVGVGVLAVAFIVNLFIREIPLRKHHVLSESGTSTSGR